MAVQIAFPCHLCFSYWIDHYSAFEQHTAGQLRNRKSGGSGGSKVSEQGETVTFADVAGVDEAKEELEEIVVLYIILGIFRDFAQKGWRLVNFKV